MITLLTGDARTVLPTLAAKSVQCCITSPPYFSLRDYDTPHSVWGGKPDCAHVFNEREDQNGLFCQDCPAWFGSLGLETEPGHFIQNLTEVFKPVFAALKDDGVLFLNLGMSYAGSGKGVWDAPGNPAKETYKPTQKSNVRAGKVPSGYRRKELIPIPWLAALALAGEGWLLRSEIIWEKSNPKPRPDRDRPTTSHETVLLFSKQPTYYYNSEAVREFTQDGGTKNLRTVWTIPTQPLKGPHTASFPEELASRCVLLGSRAGDTVLDPFSGTGTVALVANKLGRNAIAVDLNPAFNDFALKRIG